MKVTYYDSQSSVEIPPLRLEYLVQVLLKLKGIETDEVIFHFVDKRTISQLHQDFFNDPSPTDCISFPIDGKNEATVGHHILGEVFVCPEVAQEYAEKHQLKFSEELSLYIIHGLLHLLGYDDIDAEEEKIMREEEKKCMKVLKQQNALIYE